MSITEKIIALVTIGAISAIIWHWIIRPSDENDMIWAYRMHSCKSELTYINKNEAVSFYNANANCPQDLFFFPTDSPAYRYGAEQNPARVIDTLSVGGIVLGNSIHTVSSQDLIDAANFFLRKMRLAYRLRLIENTIVEREDLLESLSKMRAVQVVDSIINLQLISPDISNYLIIYNDTLREYTSAVTDQNITYGEGNIWNVLLFNPFILIHESLHNKFSSGTASHIPNEENDCFCVFSPKYSATSLFSSVNLSLQYSGFNLHDINVSHTDCQMASYTDTNCLSPSTFYGEYPEFIDQEYFPKTNMDSLDCPSKKKQLTSSNKKQYNEEYRKFIEIYHDEVTKELKVLSLSNNPLLKKTTFTKILLESFYALEITRKTPTKPTPRINSEKK